MCGSNNCRKFGLYYHEKDDCCDEPISDQRDRIQCAWFGNCPLETSSTSRTEDPHSETAGAVAASTSASTTEDPLFGHYDEETEKLGIDL